MKQSKLFAVAAALTACVLMMASDAAAQTYIIRHNAAADMIPPPFRVVKNGTFMTDGTIQQVINAIRTDAGCRGACPAIPTSASIQFGDGENALNIGSESARFFNEGEVGNFQDVANWAVSSLTLSGKITSTTPTSMVGDHYGTVHIGSGVSVTSTADITNTTGANVMGGVAISVQDGGTVRIYGGTVASTSTSVCNAIDSPRDTQEGGFVVLDGSPTITSIRVGKGKLSVIGGFSPAGKQYPITISGAAVAEGDVAVVGGANFIDNFTLANSNLRLAASGSDLVLATTTAVINQKSIAANRFGIVQSGAGLQIVGITQAAPVRVYDMRGKVLMSRQAMPNERISVSHLARGTYVVKALGKSVRLVR